ncbi:hypothetical protein [Chryseobacterium vrystaatense]|nr:hypothetical protein [Chryseobacterium vrystaatense]
MENTLENRLKFYAQHLGQNMIIDSDSFRTENGNDIIHTTLVSVSLKGIECSGWIPEVEHTALELKPLSMISDEDKIIIDNIEGVGDEENPEGSFNYGEEYWRCHYINGSFIRFPLLETYQYLQSKGYAVPFMGLSVEKQIEYGWIKQASH